MTAEPDTHAFEKHISKNALICIGCSFFQLVTRFFIPPIILHYVPIDVYGLWAYCFIFITYFGMSVIGITNVYVRYSAIYLVKHEILKINRLLSTGFICAFFMGLVFLLSAWFFLPPIFPILQIPRNLADTAFFLIFGTLCIFSFEITVSIYKFLLHGLQKVGLQWMLQSLCQFIETLLIILFLFKGYGIFSLLYAYGIQAVLANIMYAIACYRFIPNLSIKFSLFDQSVIKIFFQFGGIIQLRSVFGIINRSLTRLLSGMFVGVEATAFYDLGEKFPNTATSIPTTGLFVSLPASSHLHAKGEKEGINSLYLYGCRYMSLISGLMLGFITPFSLVLVTFWLGPDPKYKIVAFILACFAIPYHLMVVTGPASAAFRSINRPGIELIYGVSELMLGIFAVVLSFSFLGYGFTPINLGIGSTLVITSVGFLIFTNYFFNISQKKFFKKVILPGFLPYVVASLLALMLYPWLNLILENRWNAFYALFIGFLPYLFFIAPFYYFYILETQERDYLRACLKKLF